MDKVRKGFPELETRACFYMSGVIHFVSTPSVNVPTTLAVGNIIITLTFKFGRFFPYSSAVQVVVQWHFFLADALGLAFMPRMQEALPMVEKRCRGKWA